MTDESTPSSDVPSELRVEAPTGLAATMAAAPLQDVERPTPVAGENAGTVEYSTFYDFDADVAQANQEPFRFQYDGFMFECKVPLTTGNLLVKLRRCLAAGLTDLTVTDSIDAIEEWLIDAHKARWVEAVNHTHDWNIFQKMLQKFMEQSAARPT